LARGWRWVVAGIALRRVVLWWEGGFFTIRGWSSWRLSRTWPGQVLAKDISILKQERDEQ